MTLKKKLIPIVLLVLLVGVGFLVYLGQYRERSADHYYSGIVEATQANIAFQVSGRVRGVMIDEGQRVAKGDLLAALYSQEFAARRDQARAQLMQHQRQLDQLETILEVNRTTV